MLIKFPHQLYKERTTETEEQFQKEEQLYNVTLTVRKEAE